MNYLYEISTGKLVTNSSADINPIPTGMEVKVLPDADSGIWNTTTLSFDSLPETRIRSADEFEDLLTDAEYAGILTASKTDVNVEVLVRRLASKPSVNLLSQRITSALGYLQSVGLLTADRVAEIANG